MSRDAPPAPVATDEGVFGELPPALPSHAPHGGGHRLLQWLLGAALAGALGLWLAVLSVAQATDEPVALAALERAIEALTDAEALIDVQLDAVQAQADGGAERLTVPGFPIRDAGVPAAEVMTDGAVDARLLHDALLRRSARLVHTRGVDAFRIGEDAPPAAPRRSVSGVIRLTLNELSSDNHQQAVVALWLLGAACVALGGLLFAAGAGTGRVTAPGFAMTVAGVAALAGALIARLALGFVDADPGDRLVEEFTAIARDFSMLPIRNALWTAAAGVGLVLAARLIDALAARRSAPAREETAAGGAFDGR